MYDILLVENESKIYTAAPVYGTASIDANCVEIPNVIVTQCTDCSGNLHIQKYYMSYTC